VASGLIATFWLATWRDKKSALWANLSIQLIMVAGYLPTFHKLIANGVNAESFVTWGLNLAIALLFLIPPIRHRDWLSVVYVGRAVVSVGAVLGSMCSLTFGSQIGILVRIFLGLRYWH
jgi:hypothetical protein